MLEVNGVTHRMRWIPPGRFEQGSPDDEAGRWPDEGPQREVVFTTGLWLGEVPVTQELYEAVQQSNPSQFKHASRPVEQVSWSDANSFCRTLEKLIKGARFDLPTEARWEYACRAGTTGQTYAGEVNVDTNELDPSLDAIAWYGWNSEQDFELGSGVELSFDWLPRKGVHGGTHPVGRKRPNRWGLRDMLGNVWEWTRDATEFPPERYESSSAVDPSIRMDGSRRVVRGGSWSGHARNCRAACRSAGVPSERSAALGFRLAEVSGAKEYRRAEPGGK